jgi:hypothetical protein
MKYQTISSLIVDDTSILAADEAKALA